eukprot:m.310419 g.310419  ORF g.310419 m.310419 type:complete len:101 (+) comp51577_c0_seq1:39-341(+)
MGERKISVEFSGGAELLFGNVKQHDVVLPAREKRWNLGSLFFWLKDNLLHERSDLFIQGNSIRPGILVLVNDTDWELLGQTEYEINNDDRVVFISTLHGG